MFKFIFILLFCVCVHGAWILICVDSEEVVPRTPLGAEVEYAHYDTHIRNEEIYQDLCSIDKKIAIAQVI